MIMQTKGQNNMPIPTLTGLMSKVLVLANALKVFLDIQLDGWMCSLPEEEDLACRRLS